jgi:uncharacterized protein (DUF1330 family)
VTEDGGSASHEADPPLLFGAPAQFGHPPAGSRGNGERDVRLMINSSRLDAALPGSGRKIMRTRYFIALSTLAGAALGALAVQGLHAEAKPSAYVVVAVRSIKDADAMNAVREKASPAALAAAGGHYVIRTNDIISLDGTPPKRFVLIAFDSVEKAQAWHNSPGQSEIEQMRIKATDSLSFIVEGVAN